MRERRIYIDRELASGITCELPAETTHYLLNVLRLCDGSEITLFNGQGLNYTAFLTFRRKKGAIATLGAASCTNNESPLNIHLGIGISRGERMDFIMQKATEMGVSCITPLFSDRCEVKINAQRLEKRMEHWKKITINACEQSGRSVLPTLTSASPLQTWCQGIDIPHRFLLHPWENAASFPKTISGNQVAIVIGPEGGFSEDEVNFSEQLGFTCIRLGPRILRTETAPIAAISALQVLWGDFQ